MISIYQFGKSDDFFSDTVNFMGEVDKHFGKEQCIIDFGKTKQVTAAAMIVIYAAFDNARKNGEKKSVILWSKIAPAVNKAIKNTKLRQLIERTDYKVTFNGTEFLPVVASHGSDEMDNVLDYIQHRVYQSKMSPETEFVYGDAVSETINNVNLHAYPNRIDRRQKKWWLLCEVLGDQIYLAIYDTGVGIPNTVIERPWFLASLERFYPEEYAKLKEDYPELARAGLRIYVPRKLRDAQLVYLSMQGDVTGTRESKHGQGSKSIKALVSNTIDGKLWVFSGRGLFKFHDETEKPELYTLPTQLPGTLIQWNINIS